MVPRPAGAAETPAHAGALACPAGAAASPPPLKRNVCYVDGESTVRAERADSLSVSPPCVRPLTHAAHCLNIDLQAMTGTCHWQPSYLGAAARWCTHITYGFALAMDGEGRLCCMVGFRAAARPLLEKCS